MERSSNNINNGINQTLYKDTIQGKEKKYYYIEKITLATSLNFLGFTYFKTLGDSGKMIYGFEDTEQFRAAMNGLFQLRETIQI